MAMEEITSSCLGSPASECRRVGHRVACKNTVMVPVKLADDGSDVWCLGFIEDMAGDEMYINFHCTRLAPRWLPSHAVFPHDVVHPPLPTSQKSRDVLVALRASREAPLVFEAASVLVWGSRCRVCYVATTSGARRHLVHLVQLAGRLPSQPLAGRCRRQGLYAKYVLALPLAMDAGDDTPLGYSIDENRLHYEVKHSRHDLQSRPGRYHYVGGYDNRFYFRVQRDSVRIICWEYHVSFWTAELLQRGLRRLLDSGALADRLPSLAPWIPAVPPANFSDQGVQVQSLPLEVLAQVFELADAVSQAKLRRVSPVWNDVLVGWKPALVIVDMGLRVESVDKDSEMFRLGRLLQYALGGSVRSLVWTRWTPGLHVHSNNETSTDYDIAVLSNLVRIACTGQQLQRILMHRCVVEYELGGWFSKRALRCLTPLSEVCAQLLLVDYAMNNMLYEFAMGAPGVYIPRTYRWRPPFGRSLPALVVSVPILRLDCCHGVTANYNTMLAAIMQHLPPSPPLPDLLRTVTALGAYWDSVEPADRSRFWESVRYLLRFTEPVDPAAPDSPPWADVQLTSSAVVQFNSITLLVLSSMWQMVD
ncbi:uncharacterized protein LOC129587215 [Paramacrobiotus metropolitanus]|uniref:uncharacterized protein LOC129587215 n=1 Tax=Paramacrobiotus metropolitanus TaxID=2943436 RepID=UPI0024463251|nr:uncharacterized protein LOC129587215 [Paramacrobiotus metropolitanus]